MSFNSDIKELAAKCFEIESKLPYQDGSKESILRSMLYGIRTQLHDLSTLAREIDTK